MSSIPQSKTQTNGLVVIEKYSTLSTIVHDCQHPVLFQTKIEIQ